MIQEADTVRLVMVDDHQLILDGLVNMLRPYPRYEVLATFTRPHEALRAIPILKPHLVLTDLDMPEMSGAELITELRDAFPELRFILLTMYLEQNLVKTLTQKGLEGYLLKNDDQADFLNALEAVSAGKRYFSPRVTEILIDDRQSLGGSAKVQLLDLSRREREILCLIAEGYSTKEVAEELFISSGTVETHRKSLMRKLDVHNVAGLVRIAVKEGLVE